MSRLLLALPFLAACHGAAAVDDHGPVPAPPPPLPVFPPDPPAFAEAPAAAARLAAPALPASLDEPQPGRRIYVQTDKPLYRPGETVWVRSLDLQVQSLSSRSGVHSATFQLVGPRGDLVQEKRLVKEIRGSATNDLPLPDDLPGGRYTLKVVTFDGVTGERSLVVQSYDPPRIQKKLELLRDAYGPGDPVVAAATLARTTGEPLANHEVSGIVTVDGLTLPTAKGTTDAEGRVTLAFTLPAAIAVGDGLLTVLVDDGGITESVSERVPIVLAGLRFTAYPEGGDLVQGLSSRVYFEATDPTGRPADVEGQLVDDQGAVMAPFRSAKDGLGRFDLRPEPGRTYHVEITRPVGIAERFAVPDAKPEGCVLQTFDDFDSQEPAIRAGVTCSADREVTLVASQRGSRLDVARVHAPAGQSTPVYLASADPALRRGQGVARVTVLDERLQPLAERVVFRERKAGLVVSVKADRDQYQPRDTVALTITAHDPDGAPVRADLALAVVDDTVLHYADDHAGHLLSSLLLEPELQGTVEEPNAYFDPDAPGAGFAMDLLMGTHGWRHFERQVPVAQRQQTLPDPRPDPKRPRPRPMVAAMDPVRPQRAPHAAVRAAPAMLGAMGYLDGGGGMPFDGGGCCWGGGMGGYIAPSIDWASVRTFPVPDYRGGFSGPRDDFRDTVFFAPSVRTDASGEATVRFPLSDAVTAFRVTTEGVGGGRVGRSETVLASKLPFSLDVKLPTEVSLGDRVDLPVLLANERRSAMDVALTAALPPQLRGAAPEGRVHLAGGGRDARYVPLDVVGEEGDAEFTLSALADGLSDQVTRQIRVVPPGFPAEQAHSGTLTDRVTFEVDADDVIDGTLHTTLSLYPSMLDTVVDSLRGLLQYPGGCFEQASSNNYPNVLVLRLAEQERGDPALIARARSLMGGGYRLLLSYRSEHGGYEWFGGDPGHEALTAYGLVQFTDMAAVYSGVDQGMIDRTAAWLASRRDGSGGYERNPEALDSFGSASQDVTADYVTWSLVRTGHGQGLGTELDRAETVARSTDDPYRLALATDTLLRAEGRERAGAAAARRLVGLQQDDGGFVSPGHSITRSGGRDLRVETTALATMALLRAGDREEARRAVDWILATRDATHRFGSTQATILALQALVAASSDGATSHVGSVQVRVDGEPAGELAYGPGLPKPELQLGKALSPGHHTVELVGRLDGPIPYTLASRWRRNAPVTNGDSPLAFTATLDRAELGMGEVARVTAVVENRSATDGQPMTLARVGVPGGLGAQTWQLDDLVKRGVVDFYETRGREVDLYWRDLAPAQVVTVPIDLVANVPGHYTAPVSTAYLYYQEESAVWAPAVAVDIHR